MKLTRNAVLQASAHYQKIAEEEMRKRPQDRRLWSIAAEVKVGPKTWRPEIVEVQATDRAGAMAAYFLSQLNPVKIVGVAPTLGFWVNDKDGVSLSTT